MAGRRAKALALPTVAAGRLVELVDPVRCPLGHKRTYVVQKGMSALPPKADMCSAQADVRFVPKADIDHLHYYCSGAITTGASSTIGFSPDFDETKTLTVQFPACDRSIRSTSQVPSGWRAAVW